MILRILSPIFHTLHIKLDSNLLPASYFDIDTSFIWPQCPEAITHLFGKKENREILELVGLLVSIEKQL